MQFIFACRYFIYILCNFNVNSPHLDLNLLYNSVYAFLIQYIELFIIYFQVNQLGDMLENTTAIQRVKDSTPVNGAQQNIREKKSSTAFTEDLNTSNEFCIDSEYLTLWQHPITTLNYFFHELFINILSLGKKTLHYRKTVWSIVSIIILFLILSRVVGPHQQVHFYYI